MRLVRLFLITIYYLILTFPQLGYAQTDFITSNTHLNFKKYSVKQGLSQSSANCFIQDKLGFVWIGTINGLNRFDGVEFETYKMQDGLSDNNILDITEDSDGNLWIATTIGLNKYDLITETFTQYLDSTAFNYYYKIIIDENQKKIWLAANDGGIKYLNLENYQIESLSSFIYSESQVTDLEKINAEEILISTYSSGIFKLNANSLSVEPFLNDTTEIMKLPSNKIWNMMKVEDRLFIATGEGLAIYNLITKEHKLLNVNNSNLTTNFTYRLGIDADQNILVGTDGGGLNVLSPDLKVINTYQQNDLNPQSISSNVVRGIYLDMDGNLWIGTYNGGFNYVNVLKQNMMHFKRDPLNAHTLSTNNITCFTEDNDGTIWIGTDKGGLNYWKEGKFRQIPTGSGPKKINDNVIMCIKKGPDNELIIGGYTSGMSIYKKGIVENYQHNVNDSTSISEDWIWEIEVDNTGNYWIGALNGLNKFDPVTKTFTRYKADFKTTKYLPVNNIRSLLIDSKGNLWVGSYGGLGKFNIREEKYEYFISSNDQENGLTNNIIVKIFEDSKGRIWIGTYGGGLALFDKDSLSFKVFTEKDGLPNGNVQSIEEDDHGNLWISTLKGIVKFNPDQNIFQVLDENFGLQGDVFKHNSSMKNKDGFMFFGGINGFNVFHPDSIKFPDINNPVVLTDFEVFNQPVKPNDENHILKHSISYTNEISLDYANSRFFSVHFTLPNFTTPNKITFSYMLTGFNDEWIYIGNERKVTFTSLNPGSYELKVKQSIEDDIPENYTILKINIIPPFYKRKEFIGFMLMLAAFSVFGYIRYRTTSYRKRQQQLEQLVEAQNKEIKFQNEELKKQNTELSKAHKDLEVVNSSLETTVEQRTIKLKETIDQLNKSVNELDRFVYSASHDISAPLKSIQGLVNIAKIENRDKNLDVHLDYIEKSIRKLEEVIGDLIQFSRNARSELSIINISLYDFINEITHALKYLSSGYTLEIEIDIPKSAVIRSDQQRLQMIFHNLLTNAIKYQDKEKDTHWIKVHFSQNETHWTIDIKDNGIGIPADHAEKVFQMFYRATEYSDGTGLGLYIVKEAVNKLGGEINLISEEHAGTHFSVTLPNEIPL